MPEEEYYERYWKNDLDTSEGSHNKPPEHTDETFATVYKRIKAHITGKVFDAGCGNGGIISYLKPLHPECEYFGMDISSVAVASLQARMPDVTASVGDITNIPFDDNTFDTCIFSEVIEHLIDVERALAELRRVLKANGTLIITTTDFNWLKKVLIAAFVFDTYFYPTNPHIRFFTKKTLTQVLRKNGYKVLSHHWNGSYFGIMPKGQIMIARAEPTTS